MMNQHFHMMNIKIEHHSFLNLNAENVILNFIVFIMMEYIIDVVNAIHQHVQKHRQKYAIIF